MSKVVLGVVAAVVVLLPIVAAKLLYDATTYTGAEPVNQPWAQNNMEFVAWNGEKWTAWIRDETFEQRPQNQEKWHEHANISLAFVDWDSERWQAKIDGDGFLLARRGNWKDDTKHVSAIRYRDWKGKNQLRTLAQLKR